MQARTKGIACLGRVGRQTGQEEGKDKVTKHVPVPVPSHIPVPCELVKNVHFGGTVPSPPSGINVSGHFIFRTMYVRAVLCVFFAQA